MNGLDLATAHAFLAALGAVGENTFQTFAEAPGCRLPPSILHGTLDGLAATLAAFNRRGAGVFVLVNQGDGRGRRRANIVGVRALFADFDGAPLPDRWRLEPHLLVRSSPGRFHAYWRVAGLPPPEFRGLQRAIARQHGSDRSVSDLSRVMRLPGSWHLKGEPFRVRLERVRRGEPYAAAQVRAAWAAERGGRSRDAAPRMGRSRAPAVADSIAGNGANLRNPGSVRGHRSSRNPFDVAAILDRERDRVAAARVGERNTTLNRAAYRLGRLVGAGRLERRTAAAALLAAAHRCGLGDAEAERTVAGGLDAGIRDGSPEGDPIRRRSRRGFPALGRSLPTAGGNGCR